MSETSSTSGKHWTDDETGHLLDHLISLRRAGRVGDGNNYIQSAFTTSSSYLVQKGFIRTSKQCSSRYTTLKGIHRTIYNYIEKTSGTHWDNQRGANIVGDAANRAWESHLTVKVLEKMAPFKNQGWVHWDKMEEANPGQTAGGSHIFTPNVHAGPAPLQDNEQNEAGPSDIAALGLPVDLTAAASPPHASTSTNTADITAAWLETTAASSAGYDAEPSTTPTTPFIPTASSSASGANTGNTTLLSSAASSSSKGKKCCNEGSEMPPPSKKPKSSSSRLTSSLADSASSSGGKASTPSVRIMMNNTSNQVTHMMDMFKDNMASDRGRAIALIQQESVEAGVADGWSPEDVDLMIELFSYHMNLCEAYLAVTGRARRSWVLRHLSQLHQQILKGATLTEAVNSFGRV